MGPSSKSLLSPRLKNYFQDYASYHRTSGNQLTHTLGIPLIVTSLLGLLATLPIIPIGQNGPTEMTYLQLDGGNLLILAALIWYTWLDWKITLPFTLILFGLYFLGRTIPTPANWALFITGWILQGIGHAVFEKKSPAFVKNLTHLLIGPLWVFAKIIGYR